LTFLLTFILGAISSPLGIIIGVIGGTAAVVFLVWFYVIQTLAVPCLMLEDYRGLAAIRRAAKLIRGTWWSVWTTLFLMWLMILLFTLGLAIVYGVLAAAFHHATAATTTLSAVRSMVSLLVVTPFSATIVSILAIDMRIRKEGFDLELLARELTRGVRADGFAYGAPDSGPSFPSLDPSSEPDGPATDA
jgi:hypothetical protein